MSTIIKGYPSGFDSAFNPTYFYYDSTNKGEQGFKYVIDVLEDGTSNLISRLKYFPAPSTGYAVANLQQILATQVGYYFNPNLNGFAATPQNYFPYKLEVGEEYIAYWNYNNNYSVSGGTRTGFSASTATTHNFNVNDRLYFIPTTNSTYSGLYTVTNVPNNHTLEINKFYSSAGNDSGKVTTGAKTFFSGLSSASNFVVFNGVIDHQQLANFDGYNTYNINTGSTKKLLTNLPDEFPIKLDNKCYVNFFTNQNYNISGLYIKTDTGGEYKINNISTSSVMLTIGVAPSNITASTYSTISGATSAFTDNVSSYQVYLVDSSNNRISEIKSFVIDDNCSRYTNYELLFMDRKGAFSPFNFDLQSTRTINVERSQYQSTLGYLSGFKWSFDSSSVGNQVLNTSASEELELQTNWLTETQSFYFKELISSPVVFIKENGKYWPVIIKTNSLQVLTKNNKKNIQYKIIVQYGNNNSIQHF